MRAVDANRELLLKGLEQSLSIEPGRVSLFCVVRRSEVPLRGLRLWFLKEA